MVTKRIKRWHVSQALSGLIPQGTFGQLTPRISSPQSHISVANLLAAGVHLGHNKRNTNEYMRQYIYGHRNDIEIINLEHTVPMLKRAMNFTRQVAMDGGNILFVGTKPSIRALTVACAHSSRSHYILNWVGGTLTNGSRVLRNSTGVDADKLSQIVSSINKDADSGNSVGKNRDGNDLTMEQQEKLRNKSPKLLKPDLMIMLNYGENMWAAREANHQYIPVVGICDTDNNPRCLQYPIPGNDDALVSVEFIAGCLARAATEGRELAKTLKKN